tara:strand:- start:8420 stop:9013 length:594 start_codon:yes stop_codon:yes gene_type:complete
MFEHSNIQYIIIGLLILLLLIVFLYKAINKEERENSRLLDNVNNILNYLNSAKNIIGGEDLDNIDKTTELKKQIKVAQKELDYIEKKKDSVRRKAEQPILPKQDVIKNENQRELIDIEENVFVDISENNKSKKQKAKSSKKNKHDDNIIKPWEDLCIGSEQNEVSLFDELKLDMGDNINGLEPYNNDEFGEFGQFTC